MALTGQPGPEVLDLEIALDRLAQIDPRLARIVEYRYYGGMEEEEIAEALEISRRTVRREWSVARACFYGELPCYFQAAIGTKGRLGLPRQRTGLIFCFYDLAEVNRWLASNRDDLQGEVSKVLDDYWTVIGTLEQDVPEEHRTDFLEAAGMFLLDSTFRERYISNIHSTFAVRGTASLNRNRRLFGWPLLPRPQRHLPRPSANSGAAIRALRSRKPIQVCCTFRCKSLAWV